ncbi:MAG: hypothetical protein HWN66_22070 [Candidatus Helarchaeota archaeon]|nr:hypothetical protein [Candidatus Helarchaeota archaeon]
MIGLLNEAIKIFGESIIDHIIDGIVLMLECECDESDVKEDIIYYSLCAALKDIIDIENLNKEFADKLLDSQEISSQIQFTPEDFNAFDIDQKLKIEIADKFNRFLDIKRRE